MLEDRDWDYDKAIQFLNFKKNLKRNMQIQKSKMDYADSFDEMAIFYQEMADYDLEKAYQEYCMDKEATKGQKMEKNKSKFNSLMKPMEDREIELQKLRNSFQANKEEEMEKLISPVTGQVKVKTI